jgi:hypothetical protein
VWAARSGLGLEAGAGDRAQAAPQAVGEGLAVLGGAGSGAELVGKLKEIMDSQKRDGTEDPDGVTLNLLIGCYVPVEETGR